MRLIYSWRNCSIIFFGTPIRRKVRSQTSDIWTDVATVVRAVREEKESEERRSKCAKRSKCGKTLFFQCFVAPEGRKVGSLKRRSHLGRWEMNNCTRLWHRADLEVKTLKHLGPGAKQSTSGSPDAQKVHAVVARSTFWCQKCEKLTVLDHFCTFRRRKARDLVARSTCWRF